MTIAVEDRIGLPAIAKLFGVNTVSLSIAKPYLEQFPPAHKVGKKKFYSQIAVNAWAEGKDVKALVREGNQLYQRGEMAAATNKANLLNWSRRFHAGEFSDPETLDIYEKKRKTARASNQQTKRVSIRPNWSL